MTGLDSTLFSDKLVQDARRLLEAAGLGELPSLARQRGARIYLCGGSVRDLILGRPGPPPPDLDLAVDGVAFDLGRDLAGHIGGRFVALDEGHDTARVVGARAQIDLAGLRADTIEADLLARDYTINALALPLDRPGILLDPGGGRADLDARIIRHLSRDNFRADPLRLIRAFRFVAQLGFEIHPETMALISELAGLAVRPAAERTLAELYLLLEGPETGPALEAMDGAGLLAACFPELEAGREMGQNPAHHLGVREHSVQTALQAARLLADPDEGFGPLAPEVRAYAGPRRRQVLLAALLHDVGKPDTIRVEDRDDGPWATFYQHESAGERVWLKIARRLGVSRADTAIVSRLIKLHMRPWHLTNLLREGRLTRRALTRMVLAAGDDLVGLFIVALADSRAALGPIRPPRVEAEIGDLFQRALTRRDEIVRDALDRPLLDGRQVMEILGLEPGPRLGRILRALDEARLDGLIHDPDQARDWLLASGRGIE
jgi:poly(A) polymerase